METNETDLLEMLNGAKKVFLLEPPYRRKYVPLGLAKIASYIKGKNTRFPPRREVEFGRTYTGGSDLICCTTLFTHDAAEVNKALDGCRFMAPGVPIVAGGVLASLMPDRLPDVTVFRGYSKILDQCIPDYSMNWEIEPEWEEFSFTFTTRGCPNRCPYCAVHRIEKEQWVIPNWRDHIIDSKPCAMISDNNLSAYPEHLIEVAQYLKEKKKKVVFDNGLDCKLITPEIAKTLAGLRYVRAGLRLAFDRIEEDGVFQAAVRMLIGAGVSPRSIMSYVLYNYRDTPHEADYRMRECVKLGIRPYPQRYQPISGELVEPREFVGKHWTHNLARLFRYYWLMAGRYNKYGFEEWMRTQTEYKVAEADINIWSMIQ